MKTSLLFLIPSPPSLSKSFFRVPNSKLTSWNLGKVKDTVPCIDWNLIWAHKLFNLPTNVNFKFQRFRLFWATSLGSFRDVAWHTHNCLQVSVSSYKFWFNIFLFVNLVWILLSFWCSAWYDTNLTNHVALFLVCIWLFFISRF